MAAVCTRTPTSLPARSSTPPPQLSINTSQRGTPTAIPNKHIPVCSPGPNPNDRQQQPDTPPASPPSPSPDITTHSLLHPPHAYQRLSELEPVYSLTAAQLSEAVEHLATQPLPSAKQVFPWLHGLHAENQLQLAFFVARRKALRKTPRCIRGLTIVKAGGDLSHSKLKGAIAPEELLGYDAGGKSAGQGCFLEADPKDGFGVRNFQIQACKLATVSDVVVYGDQQTPRSEVLKLARHISQAQLAWQTKAEGQEPEERLFGTFVLSDDYETVECDHPDLVALDSQGCLTGKTMDFFHWERLEMCTMSAATEISHNVWLGPTPDPSLDPGSDDPCAPSTAYDLMIEASDLAHIPELKAYKFLDEMLARQDSKTLGEDVIPQLEFPGSGAIMPPTWSPTEVDGLMEACEWIYRKAHGVDEKKRRDSKLSLTSSSDGDGDSIMGEGYNASSAGRKVLMHCTDGYTETSLLALAYYMYAECVPVHEAWIQMHCQKGRNFFAYGTDVALLRAIQPRILQASPKHTGEIQQLCPPSPSWLEKMDGSLPSRITPYMYLGNLGHANNPDLLRELGIGQILSVGEPISWSRKDEESWPGENLMFVDKVQDNGVDPLTEDFGRCLEFISKSSSHPPYKFKADPRQGNGREKGTATLVHCRVGVSRSATICIAEIMNELGLSFPRAYCYVRARRLNVIIQPHLRFS